MTQRIYNDVIRNTKFFPILPDGGTENDIPTALRSWWSGRRFPSDNQGIRRMVFAPAAGGGSPEVLPAGSAETGASPWSIGDRHQLLAVASRAGRRIHGDAGAAWKNGKAPPAPTRISAPSASQRTGDGSRNTGDSHGRPDDQNDVVAQITEEFGEATQRAAKSHLARGDSVFGIVDGTLIELGRADKRR